MAALTYAVDDYIATITIQHPPANALSTQVLEDVSACREKSSFPVNHDASDILTF